MLKRFYPDIYVKNIYEINYYILKNEGINTLVFDLDNTLVPFDIEHPTKEIETLFEKLKNEGFTVLIVSNNGLARVTKFAEKLNVNYIHKAGKPKITRIKNFILENNGTLSKSAIIGDQLFTDMWVGTRLNLRKILVAPIANRDEFTVKLKRGAEKLVFKQYLKKSNQN